MIWIVIRTAWIVIGATLMIICVARIISHGAWIVIQMRRRIGQTEWRTPLIGGEN